MFYSQDNNKKPSPSGGRQSNDSLEQFCNRVWEMSEILIKFSWLMLREFFFAVRYNQVPWLMCLGICAALCIAFSYYWDYYLFKLVGFSKIYPLRYSANLHFYYKWFFVTSGFWGWLMVRVVKRRSFQRKLNEMFTCAGLQNKIGQTPTFMAEWNVDESTSVMKFTNANLPAEKFEQQKSYIEASLGIYIDSVKEDRGGTTVEIVYSHEPMPSEIFFDKSWLSSAGKDRFWIGHSRSDEFPCDLLETPHLLVAGQTASGKSTFLRQMITTLYVNNADYEFSLIDLKGGLEFQTFKDLPRISIAADVNQAVMKLRVLEDQLKKRMEQLAAVGAKDLSEVDQGKLKLSRHIIVIDECAELFLSGSYGAVGQAQGVVSKIARQGRAVGLHLIVGTQRPDSRALDSQIKSNLPGKVCFQMADNTSSVVVLGNARAKNLPGIPGRAIWQKGLQNVEVQTPYLSTDEAEELLEKFKSKAAESKPSDSKQDDAGGW